MSNMRLIRFLKNQELGKIRSDQQKSYQNQSESYQTEVFYLCYFFFLRYFHILDISEAI